MRIKWKVIYNPIGAWFDADNNKLDIQGNFWCRRDGVDLICVMTKATAGGGHGEPPITAKTPLLINPLTLEIVSVSGYVEVLNKSPINELYMEIGRLKVAMLCVPSKHKL